jgi:hypothetical protein
MSSSLPLVSVFTKLMPTPVSKEMIDEWLAQRGLEFHKVDGGPADDSFLIFKPGEFVRGEEPRVTPAERFAKEFPDG